jgi:hypothetical protein
VIDYAILCVLNHIIVGINLTAENDKGQMDAYIKNAEWDLEGRLYVFLTLHFVYSTLDFSAVNNALKYDCCPTLYPFVLFTIRIRRRSLYYVTNVVGMQRDKLKGSTHLK